MQERGFTTINDLKHFEFDELMFIPGVSESLILETKRVFSHYMSASADLKDPESIMEPFSEDTLDSHENANAVDYSLYQGVNKQQTLQPAKIKDALITDVYFNVPRSAPFIHKCSTEGKSLMSQLTEADFDKITNVKGIGPTAAKHLREIYVDFMSSFSLTDGSLEKDGVRDCAYAINHLPLSVRARNCLKRTGISSFEELLSWNEEDFKVIRNMGVKTLQEILAFRETYSSLEVTPSMLYHLENIDPENRPIPISLLHNIGISKQVIDLLLGENVLTIGDLYDRSLMPQEYFKLRIIGRYFSTPVSRIFSDAVEALKDNAKIAMSERCEGATLEEIGKELHVTRERVRQILVKTCRKLTGTAELVVGALISSEKVIVSFSDLVSLFRSETLAKYCKLALQESEHVQYFKFSDSFIYTDVCGADIESRLKKCLEEIIDKGINFYDNLELIESEVNKLGMDYFDVSDIMNFLVENRYRFYGDFVTRGAQPYAVVCYDAIIKFFKLDIKLDSDEDNEDMYLLRQIMAKHYHGAYLPPKNRSLTAGITRDSSKIILSGRGRYCPIEKVIYNVSLFEDIHRFVSDSSQTSFCYTELFSHFRGRLFAETSIDNPHFLHGMLKCLYPNEFVYERDLMSRIGEPRQSVHDRIEQLLLQKGRAMTKAEIKQAIPGIKDFTFAFSVVRLKEFIQWDYNGFNHIDNIEITREERTILSDVIKAQTELHGGYSNDNLLFKAVKDTCKEFVLRNNIANSQNLYYIALYLFGDDYRFRRPHIISKDFPVQDISAASIAQALLDCETSLNYEKYCRLSADLCWASGTLHSIFRDLEKDFIRVSDNDYIRKKYFSVSQSLISSLPELLDVFVRKAGYFAFSSIFDYEDFPKCDYKWNGFLLESIINEFDTGFRILYPQIRDRRSQRGIIVPNESSFDTFEDLVIGTLLSSGISTLTETELLKYLKMRGLITVNTIPQELYECPNMPFKNEIFTIKR